MPIKTACLKDIKKLPKDSVKVIVMRFFPFWAWIKGHYDLNAPELGPKRDLLKEFVRVKKKRGAKLAWIYTCYELRFIRYLNRSEKAQRTLKELKKISVTKDVYLICKEPTDKYCHRRLLKEYIDKLETRRIHIHDKPVNLLEGRESREAGKILGHK